jgi:streptogramin lyase
MTRLFLLASVVIFLFGTAARADYILVSSQHTDEIRRYDLATGNFVDVFASGGGLSQPIGLTWGPDGNLYVASFGTNAVLRYDGNSGAFLDVFASSYGALINPQGITFGPDGDLYVSNNNPMGNDILRFDGHTGADLHAFVAPGVGGLQTPNGLGFGPDGDLYVASQGTGQVLRYDGKTGAFIGAFAAVGAPTGLTFAPDGSLFVATVSGTTYHYDTYSGNLLNIFAGGPYLAIGPDGNLYVTTGELPGMVGRYSSTTDTFLGNLINDPGLNTPAGYVFQSAPEPSALMLGIVGLFSLGTFGLVRKRRLRYAEG